MRNVAAGGGDGGGVLARLAQDEVGVPMIKSLVHRGEHCRGAEASEDLAVDKDRRLPWGDLRDTPPDGFQLMPWWRTANLER